MSSLDHGETKIPSIHISPISDAESTMRGRSGARVENIEMISRNGLETSVASTEHLLSDSGLRPRNSSPSPSRRNSLLQRLGSLRAPAKALSTRRTIRRARGRQYDVLDEEDEGEEEQVGIDLSTLGGMGYELDDFSNPHSSDLRDRSSANFTTGKGLLRPDQSSTSQVPELTLGGGMVVGAQLTLDPTSPVVQEAMSSRGAHESLWPVNVKRAKTIREIGQQLAQKRQEIVAVEETFDLGTLEGAEIDRQVRRRESHQSFDAMDPAIRSSAGGHKSYFYPEDPDPPNWRPYSMRSIYILMLISASLGLGIFQEWLCRHSEKLAEHGHGILEFDRVANVKLFYFIAWKYLPTLIFVGYGVLWSIMDFDIKRLEPYYQLSKRTGSTAAESLNLDHLTAWSYFIPFTAVKLKQWAVFFSSFGNVLATSIAPSLQNPSINLYENDRCDFTNYTCPNVTNGPPLQLYFVRVSPGWSRALTSSLVVTAAFGVFLFFQLRRKSGLLEDPKGIAGIAAMATKSHILADFQGMDIATRGEIHDKLQHRRYVLYKSSIWQGEWTQATEPSQESTRKAESTHPLMLRLKAGIPFLLFMSLCLISIPIISLTSARVIPNAVPWLPVLAATVIKMLWTTFESDVRMMEPFYILSKGNAPPQESITLDYQGTVYGWMPVKALINGHYLVALVGLCSVLLDILTVTVSSFSVNSAVFLHLHGDSEDVSNQDETAISFWSSVTLSLAILLFSILAAGLVYLRRRHPFLPREPSTIAAALAFIHSSNMLYDFIDTETFTHKKMEEMLKAKNKSYGLGWFKGRDGNVHCAIDEEPMRSRYVHGKPYNLAQAPWMGGDDSRYV